MKQLFIFLVFIFTSNVALAFSNSGVVLNTTSEFVTPTQNEKMRSDSLYNPAWHFNDSTFFVWVDAQLRPMVTKITNGQKQTVPLDDDPSYTVLEDGHNRFGMGMDKNGYIHITGDMHNYSYSTVEQGAGKPYPARYQKQGMLYWKSNKPADISGGFSFVGGKDAPTTLPGTGWSYGKFFTDSNGELYYSARVKAIFGGHVSGEMGLGLYKYNADTKAWVALGANAEDTRPGTYFKVILWENAGMAPEKWYQGFMSDIKFDKDNRLHLAASINANNTLVGNDRIIYAYSNNGGITWFRANGTAISKLPIRAVDGLPNQGDVVAKTTVAPFFDSMARVVSDRHGRPGTVVGTLWFTWNGKTWEKTTNLVPGTTADLNNDNDVVLTRWSKLFFADDLNSKIFGYDIKDFDSYVGLDAATLKKYGVAYGVGFNSTTGLQTVLKTTITPAPLPLGWENKDISVEPGIWGGTAGFLNNQFIFNNYDIAIDNPHDSFHFVYKKMIGDGILTARVVSATNTSGNARVGIMMRDNLAFNAKHVSVLLNYPKSNAIFSFRKVANDQTNNIWRAGITLPYYVKLERVGDKFIGSISKDRLTWTEVGNTTIPMSSIIYIGLAGASYNRNTMQNVVMDQVYSPAFK